MFEQLAYAFFVLKHPTHGTGIRTLAEGAAVAEKKSSSGESTAPLPLTLVTAYIRETENIEVITVVFDVEQEIQRR